MSRYPAIYKIQSSAGRVYAFNDKNFDGYIDESGHEGPILDVETPGESPKKADGIGRGDHFLKPGTEAYQTALKDLHLEHHGSFSGLLLKSRCWSDGTPLNSAIPLENYVEIMNKIQAECQLSKEDFNSVLAHSFYPHPDWLYTIENLTESGYDIQDMRAVLLENGGYQKVQDFYLTQAQAALKDAASLERLHDFEEAKANIIRYQTSEAEARGQTPADQTILSDQIDQKLGYENLLAAYENVYEQTFLSSDYSENNLSRINFYAAKVGKTEQTNTELTAINQRLFDQGLRIMDKSLFGGDYELGIERFGTPNPLDPEVQKSKIYTKLVQLGGQLGLSATQVQNKVLDLLKPPAEVAAYIPEMQRLSLDQKIALLGDESSVKVALSQYRKGDKSGVNRILAIGYGSKYNFEDTDSFEDISMRNVIRRQGLSQAKSDAFKKYGSISATYKEVRDAVEAKVDKADKEMQVENSKAILQLNLLVALITLSASSPESRHLVGFWYQQYLQSGLSSSVKVANLLNITRYTALGNEEYIKVCQDPKQPMIDRLQALNEQCKYKIDGTFDPARQLEINAGKDDLPQYWELAQSAKTRDDFYIVLRHMIIVSKSSGTKIAIDEACKIYDSDFAAKWRSEQITKMLRDEL